LDRDEKMGEGHTIGFSSFPEGFVCFPVFLLFGLFPSRARWGGFQSGDIIVVVIHEGFLLGTSIDWRVGFVVHGCWFVGWRCVAVRGWFIAS
jgi:hypothetical protein